MARKPTRFWHPARVVVIRARDATLARLAQRNTSASLEDVRPRLQHYLRAMYGDAVLLEASAPPAKTRWPVSALRALALVKARASSESNAESIRLPTTLPGHRTNIPAVEQFRLIAVQHAERIRRASAIHARDAASDLERDLFQLAESAAIDAQIVESQPGLRAALDAARADALARRPKPRWRTEIELRVEQMFRRTWSRSNTDTTDAELTSLSLENDAESNATWARRTANALEANYGRKAAQAFRRVPEITLWQTTVRTQLPEEQMRALETEMREQQHASPPDPQRSSSRSAMPGPSNSQSSQNNQGQTPGSSRRDNASSQRDSDGANNPGDTGEPTSEPSADADTERTPGDEGTGSSGADGDGSGDAPSGVRHSSQTVPDAMLTGGITYQYPEWDVHAQRFTTAGTIVRIMPSSIVSSEWATAALRDNAREVHRARRQFERLRSHRLRLRRQVQGDELDLEACVEAVVDRLMGAAPSDRLYSQVRPGRRELAITLLIDVSGSTSEPIAPGQRVIDIERIAALVAAAAFDALGDDYSILAFSSAKASNVRVHTLKDFGETNSPVVQQRISALAPHGNTRLGAAVRHAAAQLADHPAPHRLLLILSDGKPQDDDWYYFDYAIQDSRHAVMSARLQGIHPFCITVDATDGPSYLAEIFGSAGYRVVSKPSQLSHALLHAVQRLIGTGSH